MRPIRSGPEEGLVTADGAVLGFLAAVATVSPAPVLIGVLIGVAPLGYDLLTPGIEPPGFIAPGRIVPLGWAEAMAQARMKGKKRDRYFTLVWFADEFVKL
jgi:hypothetical protein